MGERYNLFCSKCDFKLHYVDKIFVYNENSLKEMDFGMMAYFEMDKASINGWLIESYCKECDHLIKRYVINTSECDYEKMEAICKVNRLVKDKNYSLVEFGRKKYDEVIFCPNCGSDILHNINEIKICPKCGGDFLKGPVCLFD